LWKLLKRHARAGKPLRNCLHLPRVEQHFAQPEALVQIEQRAFHRGLEIQGLVLARLKNPMRGQTNLLRFLILGDGDDGSGIALDRSVHADPDRQITVANGVSKPGIDASVPGSHVDEA
jgi:hypothetical protein